MMKWMTMLVLVTMVLSSLAKRFPTREWQEGMVQAHNDLRRAVYPSADKMNLIRWNNQMARYARSQAKRCRFEHGKRYGENIFKGGYLTPRRVAMAWYKERKNFNFSTAESLFCAKDKTCGHYTQMISSNVKEIGCGYALCGRWYEIFCEYGNGNSRYNPYNEGEECTACPLCLQGLCVTKQWSRAHYRRQGVSKLRCKNCDKLERFSLTCIQTHKSCSDACISQAVVCHNGGSGVSVSQKKCECRCTKNYFGPRCQFSRKELKSGIMFALRGPQFDYNTYPVSPYQFKTDVFSKLRSSLVPAINAYCAKNYTECCPMAVTPPGSHLVSHRSLQVSAGFPRITRNGDLNVALVVKLAGAKHCPGSEFLPNGVFLKVANESLKNTSFLKMMQTTVHDLTLGNPNYDVTKEFNQFSY